MTGGSTEVRKIRAYRARERETKGIERQINPLKSGVTFIVIFSLRVNSFINL